MSIVLQSIYRNLIVLRFLVEMCEFLFNVQFLGGPILDFPRQEF